MPRCPTGLDQTVHRIRDPHEVPRMWRRLRWTRRRKARTSVTGLVLSDGAPDPGSRSGPPRYLYDRVSISPTVITGTSAAAILGTLLAQGGSRAEQRQILTKIEGAAQRLESSEDLFRPTPWFADLGRRLRGQSSA